MKKLSVILTTLFLCAFGFSYVQAEEANPTPQKMTGERQLIEPGDFLAPTGVVRKQRYDTPPCELPKNPKPGDRVVFNIDSVDYAFRWCPPGEFMMGGNLRFEEKPIHKVKLSGFWILETEVTKEMWSRVMRDGPSSERIPVTDVKMWDIENRNPNSFCTRLSRKFGRYVNIPTEAEWEYACRAGTTGDYAGNLDEMAWYAETSDHKIHEVGLKKPNAWGLCDMHGNVWEWCLDYYDDYYYADSPSSNPKNNKVGKNRRVIRGGSFVNNAENCRSVLRNYYSDDLSHETIGFRICLYGD